MRRGELRRRFGRTPVPDEARERTWRTIQAAFAEREPVPAARGRAGRRGVVLLCALVVLTALSPAGADMRRWLGRTFEAPSAVTHSRVGLDRLPGGGRLLVLAGGAAWTVQPDGVRRHLGAARDARWSPFGRFVALAGDRGLTAVDPHGGVRWALTRSRVRSPVWSGPDGYRIAYRTGSSLRVVAGDGTGDRLLARRVAPVEPAWRPGSHVVAYVDGRGRVRVRDVDRGPPPDRGTSVPGHPRALGWAPTSGVLTVAGERAIVRLAGARVRARIELPRVTGRTTDVAIAPDGRRVAYARVDPRTRTGSVVVVERRRMRTAFSGAGPFRGLVWSPDGRWLLVDWPAADEWVALRTQARPRLSAFSRIGSQFGGGPDAAPRAADWCCVDTPG